MNHPKGERKIVVGRWSGSFSRLTHAHGWIYRVNNESRQVRSPSACTVFPEDRSTKESERSLWGSGFPKNTGCYLISENNIQEQHRCTLQFFSRHHLCFFSIEYKNHLSNNNEIEHPETSEIQDSPLFSENRISHRDWESLRWCPRLWC